MPVIIQNGKVFQAWLNGKAWTGALFPGCVSIQLFILYAIPIPHMRYPGIFPGALKIAIIYLFPGVKATSFCAQSDDGRVG
jgi:hypothetical protein